MHESAAWPDPHDLFLAESCYIGPSTQALPLCCQQLECGASRLQGRTHTLPTAYSMPSLRISDAMRTKGAMLALLYWPPLYSAARGPTMKTHVDTVEGWVCCRIEQEQIQH